MTRTARAAFRRGLLQGAPFLLVIVPFGMVFGVVATEAGLAMAEVMGLSILVIAGASQVAAVQLMSEGAPVAAVLAAALVINLRLGMYSASLAPHLGGLPLRTKALIAYMIVDQAYAASVLEYERRPELTLPEKAAYYFGAGTVLCGPWYLSTWAGASLGQGLPEGMGLDFAVPITFLALLAAMLRTLAHWAAAAVSVAVALALAGLPPGLGLLIAAAAAMVTGAAVEVWCDRRAARQGTAP